MTIPTNLIERALNLTGQNYKDFSFFYFTPDFLEVGFCFYLLSPEFIKKYLKLIEGDKTGRTKHVRYVAEIFGQAIYEYQRKDKEFPDGNPGPIISLLEKIPGQQKLT